jgi:SAM-dependent methyltransferase
MSPLRQRKFLAKSRFDRKDLMATASPGSDYGALDVPYVRMFIPELAPAWLDHVAILSGVAPPARQSGFSWCDLGCGQGVTAVMLAAMHPAGEFYGIDMMPAHIDHARRLATEAKVPNATFHAIDFGAVADLKLPRFDYIVVHGVYTWVNAQVRADLRSFIDLHLKPDGLVYLSYNALPGRAADLPLQRLVRALGESLDGNSIERVAAALQIVHSVRDLKVQALATSPMLARINQAKENYAATYLAHELLAPHWEPLSVTDVRADMALIGLEPVGSATLVENYDSFVLKRAACAALADIADPNLRELLRDFFIDQAFRRDVFARGAHMLGGDDQRRLMLASAFGLTRQPSRVAYVMAAPAGRISFDNATSRDIVAALASAPATLGEIAQQRGIADADAVASALALCAAGQMQPAEPVPAPVTSFNTAVLGRLNGPEEIAYLAMPFGTHIFINDAVREMLAQPLTVDAEPSWQDFLAVHGWRNSAF